MEQIAVEKYYEGLRRLWPQAVFFAIDELHKDQETSKRPTISRIAQKVGEMLDSIEARKKSSKGHPRAPWDEARSASEKMAFVEDDGWWDARIKAATPELAKRLVTWRKALAAGAGPEVFTGSPKPIGPWPDESPCPKYS